MVNGNNSGINNGNNNGPNCGPNCTCKNGAFVGDFTYKMKMWFEIVDGFDNEVVVKSDEYWLPIDNDYCCGPLGDRLNAEKLAAFMLENVDFIRAENTIKICSDDKFVSL